MNAASLPWDQVADRLGAARPGWRGLASQPEVEEQPGAVPVHSAGQGGGRIGAGCPGWRGLAPEAREQARAVAQPDEVQGGGRLGAGWRGWRGLATEQGALLQPRAVLWHFGGRGGGVGEAPAAEAEAVAAVRLHAAPEEAPLAAGALLERESSAGFEAAAAAWERASEDADCDDFCLPGAPSGLGLVPPMLQYENPFGRQSVNSFTSGTADGDDEDLAFCLLTPHQALGALGSHAPHYTKVFLNGLPFVTDQDTGAVLSVDEYAHRMQVVANRARTAASCASRATSLPSSPCLTPPNGRHQHHHHHHHDDHQYHHHHHHELDHEEPAPPLRRSAVCSASASFRSLASSSTDTLASAASSVRPSPTCSLDAGRALRLDQHSTECERGEAASKGSTATNSSSSSTEGPRYAAPQVLCDSAVSNSPCRWPAYGSSSGGRVDDGGRSCVAGSPASERQRSASDCGGGAHPHDCCAPAHHLEACLETCSGDGGSTPGPTPKSPSAPALVHGHPVTPQQPGSAPRRGAARAALAAEPHQPAKRRWLPSGCGASGPPRAAAAPAHGLRGGAPARHAAGCHASWAGLGPVDLRASVDIGALASLHASDRPRARCHAERTGPRGGAALPPPPPARCSAAARQTAAPASLPPRTPLQQHPPPPRPCAAVTAAAAARAAAAASAPAGLCRAPALPLPDGDTPESSVPPALRYYLAQARAAGVQVDAHRGGDAAAGGELGLELGVDGRALVRSQSSCCGGGAVASGGAMRQARRDEGYVRAAVEQLQQRGVGVGVCHITPFAQGLKTSRKPRSMQSVAAMSK